MRQIAALLVLPLGLFIGGAGCKQKQPAPPPAPNLKSITPPIGDFAGGQQVVLRGENFDGANEVKFGAVAANAVTVGAGGTTITCLTPPNSKGAVAVSVTGPGGTASVPNAFTYVTQVFVTTLDPDHVPANQTSTVTIRGKGLVPPLSVRLTGTGDVSASAAVQAGTELAVPVTIPALEVGTYDVTVTNGENQLQTSPVRLTVTPPIRVTLIDPDSGFADEEVLVHIEGTGFAGVTAVLAGTAPCGDVLVEDATRLSCKIPAGTPGKVDVVVRRTPGDETKVIEGFTRYSPTDATMKILYADPRAGRTTGGQETLIAATGLNGQTPTVTIAGLAATVISVEAGRRAKVRTPACTAVPCTVSDADVFKKVSISVSAATGTDSRQEAFTYYVRPSVGSLQPAKGGTVGGDTVAILGQGFTARDLRVTFDGIAATDVVRVSGTRLTCKAPPHAAGFVNVVITSEFDASDAAANAFEYREAVRITSLDPPNASIAGGTIMEATGSGFVQGRMEVKVDGVALDSPTVSSNTKMRFVTKRRDNVGTTQLTVHDTAGTDPDLSTGNVTLDFQNKTVPGGGVGGGVIRRNITVSVVRQGDSTPIPGSTVFVGDRWQSATYKGATDDRGMLVLAANDLGGPVKITAAHNGYEYQTRVGMNAAELTMALLRTCQVTADCPAGEECFQNLCSAQGTPTASTITGTVANWSAAGYPLGYAPGVVKRIAVVWMSEPDQGFPPPDPGFFNVIAEEPGCDITVNNSNTALPTTFTLNASPGGRVALMAVVYFYDSRDGVCNPEAAPGTTQPNPQGEGFLPVTASAVGLLTDINVQSGTNPGANIPINRTVTDGMRVNLVGAPALGGAGQTARTVDAILDVGGSGVFSFINPISDSATIQFNQATPLAGINFFSGADFMNVIPSAVPAPGGDLKYILHALSARPAVDQGGNVVGFQLPYSEVWKRGVTAAEETMDAWYGFPAGMSPAAAGTLQARRFGWTAFTQTSSFIVLDVGHSDAQGNVTPRWTVFMPGDAAELVLPEVAGSGVADDLAPGTNLWQVSGYALFTSDGFDFQAHNVGDLGEPHWRARVASEIVNFQMP